MRWSVSLSALRSRIVSNHRFGEKYVSTTGLGVRLSPDNVCMRLTITCPIWPYMLKWDTVHIQKAIKYQAWIGHVVVEHSYCALGNAMLLNINDDQISADSKNTICCRTWSLFPQSVQPTYPWNEVVNLVSATFHSMQSLILSVVSGQQYVTKSTLCNHLFLAF